MNDKQLAQIDEWLDGQKRYKLLDCEQTAFLQLKGALLQVWMACFIHENDDQESWLSNSTLMRLTGIRSEHTVIDARRWLVENGWIRDKGHVAAIKYVNPTQGAYTVPVMSVDNPCKNCSPAKNAVPPRKTTAKNAPAKNAEPPAKSADNVSAVAFAPAVAVASTVEPTTTLATPCMTSSPSEIPSLREDEKQQQKQKTSASAVKWLEKYTEPKPVGFDVWTQESRSAWCVEHKRKAPPVEPVESKPEASPAVGSSTSAPPTPPPNTPPPPARWNCPACEFGHKHGYAVAEHIEDKHPELGQQSFQIECVEAGCNWGLWWNKVDNNKDKMEAEFLDHLETQHNPGSPRYNPYKY
jgi:hypothetical protein